MRYFVVDGMYSGTGVRDAIGGGYLRLEQLMLSAQLIDKISTWLCRYEDAHFTQYEDDCQVKSLDEEGLEICRMMEVEIPDSKVEYFSSAQMRRLMRK